MLLETEGVLEDPCYGEQKVDRVISIMFLAAIPRDFAPRAHFGGNFTHHEF